MQRRFDRVGLAVVAGVLGLLAVAVGVRVAVGHNPAAASNGGAGLGVNTNDPGLGSSATAGNSPSVSAGTTRERSPRTPTPPEGAVPAVQSPPPTTGESVAESSARFVMPLRAWTAVTDRFGAPRGQGLVHGGIDLALNDYPKSGVLAACDGTLLSTATNDTYGNFVVVDCGGGWTTLYAHLSSIRSVVGQPVTKGTTVLGVSGSTGFSTGEHLHFEIRYKNVPMNPETYLDFNIPPGTPLTLDPDPNEEVMDDGSGLEPEPPTVTPTPRPTPTVTPTPRVPLRTAAVTGTVGSALEGSVAATLIRVEPAESFDKSRARFTSPVSNWTSVGDRFGAPRGDRSIHAGIDLILDGRPGSDVVSACDGFVKSITKNKADGDSVFVDCGDGWSTLYGHLGSERVQEGQRLFKGETVIGTSSRGGGPIASRDVLHFEIRYLDVPRDPELYLEFKIPPGTLPADGEASATPAASPIRQAPPSAGTPVPPATGTGTPSPAPIATEAAGTPSSPGAPSSAGAATVTAAVR